MLIIPYQSTFAQEVQHAPTVEQCRADQKLWMSQLEHEGPLRSGVAELFDRKDEMMKCETVDPKFHIYYYHIHSEISDEESLRLLDFLYRHNLSQQFMAEDVQGER